MEGAECLTVVRLSGASSSVRSLYEILKQGGREFRLVAAGAGSHKVVRSRLTASRLSLYVVPRSGIHITAVRAGIAAQQEGANAERIEVPVIEALIVSRDHGRNVCRVLNVPLDLSADTTMTTGKPNRVRARASHPTI